MLEKYLLLFCVTFFVRLKISTVLSHHYQYFLAGSKSSLSFVHCTVGQSVHK